MELDRRMMMEIAIAIGGVGSFIAALLFVGATFNENGLSDQGALALIGLIAAFILVMTGLGYWLSAQEA